jgi:cytochrome P450
MKTCVGYYTTLSGAGHDTTASTLASCIEALAHHPEQLAAVKADPKKIMGLINESLRWATPAKHFVHQAATDYELNGAQIRQGDRLMLLFQSANRDEDVFQAPDEFHFDRKPNSHLAFGSGPHACMGQLLAKQELRIMLEELLPRLESIELAGGRQVVQTNFVGGLKSLPLRLTMGE